jgi:hypothetical protein
MVYHMDTKYDVSLTDEETEYDDLTDEQKAKYDILAKWDAIESQATSYASTNYKSIIYKNLNDDNKDNDLKIYDPVFEYKYYNSNSDVYELIDKAYFKNDVIFSYENKNYTVDDFYKDAATTYATEILTNYFELEYAYSFLDKYLYEDTISSNETAVDDAISNFNNNGNSQYPSSMGLENYLLIAYGYENRDDVVKYYFNANSCLTKYMAETVFEDWAVLNQTKTDEAGKNIYDINSEYETKGVL